MCGGSGTRLWPLPRSCYPKQFVEFDKGTTLFKSTLERAFAIAKTVRPIIVCNESHRFLVKCDLDELGFSGKIINEPMSRNTAPAIAYAAFEAVKRTPDAVLLVFPSDHAIEGLNAFPRKGFWGQDKKSPIAPGNRFERLLCAGARGFLTGFYNLNYIRFRPWLRGEF